MKVAISSSGNDLNAQIDPRFGRCPCFLFVETDDMSFEVFDNPSRALKSGAGIESARFVACKGAWAVITGNCGPNAMRVLSAAGIDLFLGNAGTVIEAIEKFRDGRLSAASRANVPEYSGLGGIPAGSGMGMGMGRGAAGGRGMGGRGFGCGIGLGRGRGMGGGRGLGGGRRMP